MINTLKKIYRWINPVIKYDPKNQLYSRSFGDIKLVSHSLTCIEATFSKIFFEDIYAFEPTSESPVIIDAGANIGLGVLYWKNKYPQAKIIAFEPSKQVFSILDQNVKLNQFAGVELVNKGLSNVEGTFLFTADEGVSGSLVTEKKLDSTYEIETVKLSSYISGDIDFLKLDIEGAELDVLLEIQGSLGKVKNLFVEYHAFTHKPQELSIILDLLEKNGFRYYLEGEYHHHAPLVKDKVSLGQDLQVSIWAKRPGA